MALARRGSAIARWLGLIGLAVPVIAFAAYSMRFGLRGLGADLSAETYIYTSGAPLFNLAIFAHMVLGAVIMLLVPLQLSTGLRLRFPRQHRLAGRVIVGGAVCVALGGLAYIGLRGTIAGPLMDLGFAVYGGLFLLAAAQTLRHAHAGNHDRHRDWALRLLVLIMGSLLFRLHYVLWYLLTDGLWSTEQLDGPFDKVQYFAFYLPYLALLELWIRRRGRVRA